MISGPFSPDGEYKRGTWVELQSIVGSPIGTPLAIFLFFQQNANLLQLFFCE